MKDVAAAIRLKQENPTWGYKRIADEIGWDRHRVRRAIEHAERKHSIITPALIEIEPHTADEFAERITSCWRKSVESVIEVGRLLTNAKSELDHGEFTAMVNAKLPFGSRTAARLMAIGRDERLTNRTHVSVLPNSWGTLYELTKLDDDEFQARITDGTIKPDMQRQDIAQTIKTTQRATRERVLGGIQLALPTQKFGVIVADPEWRFEPWSRLTGMDRAADNHYPTSVTDVIAARDVASIAADDCVLFLWATGPMTPQALMVMGAWGFDYKSQQIWNKRRDHNDNGIATTKPAIGTGYWFRNCHELLLVGTRGNIPAPAPGTQWLSVIDAIVGRHSEKPECFLDMIDEYFSTLPKIELNRRGPARPGWSAWGNESAEAAE